MNSQLLKKVFRISVFAKGIDGLLEFFGAIALSVTSSAALQTFVYRITAHELTEDPTDLIAHTIRSLAIQAGNAKLFGVFFLLFHGIIKLVLVYYLLKEDIRAYPWAVSALLIFAIYQTYLAWHHPTAALLGLTFLDFLIVGLAIHEWLYLRRITPPSATHHNN